MAELTQPGSVASDVPEIGVRLSAGSPTSLDPRTVFGRHTTPGEQLDVVTGATTAPGAAFRPDDPDLAGYVVLDFAAFQWREDDEEIIGHSRDPFHRVDIRASSLLYETLLPVRYYILLGDVRLDLMEESSKRTVYPYKGEARYCTYPGTDDGRNVAWGYDRRFSDAAQIHGC